MQKTWPQLSSNSAGWFVDLGEKIVGPITDLDLREGLLVERWGKHARVSPSNSGPWTPFSLMRQQYFHLISEGWYVRSEIDGSVRGPYASAEMRCMAESGQLAKDEVRRGLEGRWAMGERAASALDASCMPQLDMAPPESAGQIIQSECQCPHCWHEFLPEEVLWIAAHPTLLGDEVLGQAERQRFVACEFTVGGDALDSRGEVCTQLACPRCHLEIPRALIELQSTLISVVGGPGSGKSYFLATSVERVQRRLSENRMLFRDAQVDLNAVLSGYRRTLFWSDQPDQLVWLPKTQPQGNLYQSVNLNGRDIWYPKPFMFRWLPKPDHNLHPIRASIGRVVCLYDNAGEHFLPGSGSSQGFATDHLRLSKALVFLFDPTQHAPLLPKLRLVSSDPQLDSKSRSSVQSQVLDEVLERIRRHRGVTGVDRIPIPLIVAVTKMDIWEKNVKSGPFPDEVDLITAFDQPAIDMKLILDISRRTREWLCSSCPEIVHAAESQVEKVFYIPTSSQGVSPEYDRESTRLMVKPSALSPRMADTPLLVALHFAAPRMLPCTDRESADA